MSINNRQSHTSARKKVSASSSTSRRTGKLVAKSSKAAKKSKAANKAKKKDNRSERLKKLEELTLKAFRMAYESNQRGEFWRI
jgi:Na+/phosphate symporter